MWKLPAINAEGGKSRKSCSEKEVFKAVTEEQLQAEILVFSVHTVNVNA